MKLDPSEATEYRGMVARGIYLSADRLDIKYAVKELSRWMSAPIRKDWRKLVRLRNQVCLPESIEVAGELE